MACEFSLIETLKDMNDMKSKVAIYGNIDMIFQVNNKTKRGITYEVPKLWSRNAR